MKLLLQDNNMGGAVSELRGEIHTHVLIVQHYPMFLEPVLAGTYMYVDAFIVERS